MQTVHKAGQVLGLFSVDRPEWGVSEVAQELGFPKSSTSGLMSALAEQGLLQRTGARRYKLGWQIMAMSRVLLETTKFRDEARRAMERLISLFGETVHLAALERGRVIYVDKLQGTRAVSVTVTAVGGTFPAHATSVGKAILAHRPWAEVAEVLERGGMPKLAPNTITTLERFREELKRVCERGYAYDIEESVPELCCVGAPIRDFTGEVVASISLSVPSYRFSASEEKYRVALCEKAREVSRNLGYVGTRQRSSQKMPKEVLRASG